MRVKHIQRDNKVAIYFHLTKKRAYIYLPENAIIEKDKKNGYIVKVDEIPAIKGKGLKERIIDKIKKIK